MKSAAPYAALVVAAAMVGVLYGLLWLSPKMVEFILAPLPGLVGATVAATTGILLVVERMTARQP